MPDQLRWGRRVLLVCSTAARMVMFSRMRTSSQSSYVGGRGRPGEPAASWHWVSFCSFSKVCGTFPIIRRSVRRSSAGWQPKGIELIAFDDLKPENRTRWKPYRLLETDLISDNLPTLPHRSIHFPLMSHPERSFARCSGQDASPVCRWEFVRKGNVPGGRAGIPPGPRRFFWPIAPFRQLGLLAHGLPMPHLLHSVMYTLRP
jgi:hypothetical protein